MPRTLLAVSLALFLLSPSAFPGGTGFWQMDTFQDFARGTFTGISLSRDGKLSLAPRLEEVFSTGQALVWAIVEDGAGNVYLGTGHSGKVFRLDAAGEAKDKGREFFAAPEPDVFALAVDRKNNLYVGTSPDGKVYKVSPEGRAQEFFHPQAKYIWSMVADADGALYVGTGDRGRIYRVSPDGQGALFFDTRQSHVMSLALAPDQTLVAGSDPNGLLYRISRSGKGFVLYDAPLAEIHSVAVAPDGSVFASAIAGGAQRGRGLGGIGGEGLSSSESSIGPVTITVQAAPPVDPDEKKDRFKEKPREGAERAAREAAAAAATAAIPAGDSFAGARSAIYRVAPDRTVETIWSSRDESAYDILPAAGARPFSLLFSTDERGRVYQLNADRQTTLLVQTNEEQTTRLLRRGPQVLAATSNFGKLFRLEAGPAEQGWYESPVKDTRSISRWGKLGWRAEVPASARLEFFTRSGNSATPDPTWSDWEATTSSSDGGGRPERLEEQVRSPAARYLQWKAVFHSASKAGSGAGAPSAALQEVSVAYLPQNRAPIIHSVTVNPSSSAPQAPRATATAASAAGAGGAEPVVVIVDDTAGGAGKSASPLVVSASPGAGPGSRPGAAPSTVTVSWQAEDPDGDRLAFSLFIRGEGEQEWRLLKDNLHETSFQVEPETLPDGKYQVRLLASDAEANPQETARTAEQTSAPFLIDNTPPVVRLLKQERSGNSAQVRFEASDAASVLRRAEYSLDGGPWLPVYSEDGIIDSRTETFLLQLANLSPGEHVVVLRAYDSGNNAGIGKAVLK